MFRKGLIQQRFIVLRETIINYVIINVLKRDNLQKKAYKKVTEVMLNSEYEEILFEV